jgi:Raf kinase inhibitor-like YbhB/YbcL family protein
MRSLLQRVIVLLLFVVPLWVVGTSGVGAAADVKGLQLTSSAFAAGGEIPQAFTCEGKDMSPPLAWSDPPATAKSFALIADDPDAPDPKAPKMVFVHRVLYNLPPATRALASSQHGESLPAGAAAGKNDWKKTQYGGPCPPTGRHRYFFKLYALDTTLPSLHEPSKAELERAMVGHVVAKAELVGTYEKKK